MLSSPIPSIPQTTTSPACRWSSGPTGPSRRAGVPVAIRSPGRSVHVAAEVRDDLGDRETHLRGAAVLDQDVVHGAPHREVVRVERLGGHDDGSDRAEAGHRLAEEPLVAVEPRVARRDVVDHGVAEDVRERVLDLDVGGGLADHDAQLDLRVHVRREGAIPGDHATGRGDRRWRLGEDEGALGTVGIGVGGDARGPVVVADGVDRAGVGHGGPGIDVGDRAPPVVRLAVDPGGEIAPGEGVERRELAHRRRLAGPTGQLQGEEPAVADHDRHRDAVRDDGREAHRQAVAAASARSGATAVRMTSAIPPTPVQRSNAIAAWAISISEPLAARARGRAPRRAAASRAGRRRGRTRWRDRGAARRRSSRPDGACRRSSR